jgi:hypothetical protein
MYKEKYLKYKLKYLDLKGQIGGGLDDEYPEQLISFKKKLGITTLEGLFSTSSEINIIWPLWYFNNEEISFLAKLFVDDIKKTTALTFLYDSKHINFESLKYALLHPNKLFYFITNPIEETEQILKIKQGRDDPFFMFTYGKDDIINFQLRFIFDCINIKRRESFGLIIDTKQIKKGLEFDEQEAFQNSFNTIIEGLQMNIELVSLFYRDNIRSQDQLDRFAKALQTNTTLIQVYLSGCTIRFDECKEFANVLLTNSTLTRLGLEDNDIRSDGMKAIAEALVENTTLTYINLNRNHSDADGATALAEALKTNKTLKELWFSKNNIGDIGSTAFRQALDINTTLEKIVLEDNNISKQELIELQKLKEFKELITQIYI